MNNEMMYSLFVNSVKNMSDDELKNALEKTRGMLSDDDYQKLVALIKKERDI